LAIAGSRCRRVNREVVARLHLGALYGLVGARQEGRSADVGEVPAKSDKDVRDQKIPEIDAGEIDKCASELDGRTGDDDGQHAKALDQVPSEERRREHGNVVPLDHSCTFAEAVATGDHGEMAAGASDHAGEGHSGRW
jgi:hypothetical protein